MRKKKTNVAEARNKIKQMFQAEMIKELKNLYISNDNNGIKAFGRFRIRNQKDTGLFTVAEEHWDTSPEFMTARNAMAFCVFQHNKHSESAKEVYNLDGKLASINLDIAVHTRGYKSKKNPLDHRLIQLTKLQNDLELTDLHQTVISEMKKNNFENIDLSRLVWLVLTINLSSCPSTR